MTTQAFGDLQVGKGGLPPLNVRFSQLQSLIQGEEALHVERGQATLPNLQITEGWSRHITRSGDDR